MKLLFYHIVIEPDENNTFHGYVPALKGCHTWGDSVDEVKWLLKDAIELYVGVLKDYGESIPEDKIHGAFEIILVPAPV